jgi:hypothetical protein
MDHGEQLGRIETKLDTALETLHDHETRIRTGERWRNRLTGAWGFFMLLVSGVTAYIWSDQ